MTSALPLAGIIKASWMDDSICTQVDPELFFPGKNENPMYAKLICRQCPVQERCLQWALDNEEVYGIWGGMTAEERQRLLNTRLKARSSMSGWNSMTYGHGTPAGARRHWREGSRVCDRCKNAANLYRNQIRQSKLARGAH